MTLLDPTIKNLSLTEVLVEKYYQYIVRLSYSILRNREEAEDVTQDVFIAALTNIDKCDPDSNLKAWLSKIAINKCRDILRKQKTKQRFQISWQSFQELTKRSTTPEETAVTNETTALLWAQVNKLKEKHRIPIILRYTHNLSIREIAEILEIKEGTIHSRLHYACKKLGKQLEEAASPSPLASEAIS